VDTATCQTCRWFRSPQTISERLLEDLSQDRTERAVVQKRLDAVRQDEREKKDVETRFLVDLTRRRVRQWPIQPTMLSYCALLEEAQGVFLVHQVKNLGGACGRDGSYQRREGTGRSCPTCRHRRPGEGEARDEREYAIRGRMDDDAFLLRGQRGTLFNEYLEEVADRKAREAELAYFNGRITPKPPDYLSTCAKYSNDSAGELVLCAQQNPHEECPGWAPAGDKAMPLDQALALLTGQSGCEESCHGAAEGDEPMALEEALAILTGKPRPPADSSPPAAGRARVPLHVIEAGASQAAAPSSGKRTGASPSREAAFGCPSCVHYGAPHATPTLDLGEYLSPKQYEALLEDLADQEKLKAAEEQEADQNGYLHHPPQFFSWCRRRVPGPKLIRAIEADLARGSTRLEERARNNGPQFLFKVDAANGRLILLHELCMHKNPKNSCKDYRRRKGADA
jgi:hypothetical protein